MNRQPIIEFTDFSFQYFSQQEPTLYMILILKSLKAKKF